MSRENIATVYYERKTGTCQWNLATEKFETTSLETFETYREAVESLNRFRNRIKVKFGKITFLTID